MYVSICVSFLYICLTSETLHYPWNPSCVFLVFLLYCIEIFILIIQILLKLRNKLLFNQFVEPRKNANILEMIFIILFVMRAFCTLGARGFQRRKESGEKKTSGSTRPNSGPGMTS